MDSENKFVKSKLTVVESPEAAEFAKADLLQDEDDEECKDRLKKAIEEQKKLDGGLS